MKSGYQNTQLIQSIQINIPVDREYQIHPTTPYILPWMFSSYGAGPDSKHNYISVRPADGNKKTRRILPARWICAWENYFGWWISMNYFWYRGLNPKLITTAWSRQNNGRGQKRRWQ
jgi:hypothetical protein